MMHDQSPTPPSRPPQPPPSARTGLIPLLALLVALGTMILSTEKATAAELKIGMIGLDTSHVVAFTELLNNPSNKQYVAGGKVVAAYRGGSPDIESSITRVDGYTQTLREKYGVRILDTIEAVCQEVDVVMLTSVDGRPHLAQARPVFAAKKPMYIDKPIGGTLRDAVEIIRLSKANRVPIFTSSAYRYYDSLTELKRKDVGEIKGAISYGPCHLEPHHPDFYWYGVHPAEALYTVLGTGCESVVRTSTPDTDVVTGVWKDGKVGILRGLRNASTPHRVILFGTKSVAEQNGSGDYAPLIREVMRFFQTGVSPVPIEETLELFTFMEAADESKRQGGAPVRLADVLARNGGTP